MSRSPLIQLILFAAVFLSVFCSRRLSAADQPFPIIVGFERARFDKDSMAVQAHLLVSGLRCRACHGMGAEGGLAAANVSDAERGHLGVKRAPLLEAIGARLRPSFVRSFLGDPQGAKPGTTMPDLLHGLSDGEERQAIEALVQFLFSLPQPQGPPRPGVMGDAARGRELYHSIGCVACHAPDPEYRIPDLPEGIRPAPIEIPSVPLGGVATKYQPAALTQFLLDPLATRADGSMPRMGLSRDEAADVAAYLMAGRPAPETPQVSSPELVAAGRELYATLGCIACHGPTGDPVPAPTATAAPPFADLASGDLRGCLSSNPPAQVPDFSLSVEQREVLRGAVKSVAARTSPRDRLERSALAFNCYACHGGSERRVEPGRAVYFRSTVAELGDEGRFPPDFHGAGRKFRVATLEAILTGRGAVRSYMTTRMPDFGEANARRVQDLLIANREPDRWPQEVLGRNRFGRRLVGKGGMSCISCHDFAGHRSLGIRAMDLVEVTERLRPQWFRDYLLNPGHFRMGTRMPSFWPEGKSSIKDVLSGDPLQQFDAIWVYLREAAHTRLPDGMEPTDAFEIVPRERPVVFRTFFEGAGRHAIAVGYPQQLHVAFDADIVRLALLWKGRFLDAEGTWDDRFAPLATPRGQQVVRFATAPSFAILEESDTPWPRPGEDPIKWRFDGYRLNDKREPVFLYRWRDMGMEEGLSPLSDGRGFLRTISLEGAGENVWHLAARGRDIQVLSGNAFLIDKQLQVIFPSVRAAEPRVRRSLGLEELIVPVKWRDGEADITVYLEW